jgi:ABC-type sugar transport system ATPase subunit
LIPTLSVAENLFLNRLPARLGVVRHGVLRHQAGQALTAVGLESLDPMTAAGRLGVGEQQLVEIAPALACLCRVLILDEPTAALSSPQVERLCRGVRVREVSFELRRGEILGVSGLVGSGRTELLRAIFGADRADSGALYLEGSDQPQRFHHPLIQDLASRGKGIVVVSSEVEELMLLCGRIAVLSAGRPVQVFDRGEWSQERLLAAAFQGYSGSRGPGGEIPS